MPSGRKYGSSQSQKRKLCDKAQRKKTSESENIRAEVDTLILLYNFHLFPCKCAARFTSFTGYMTKQYL